MVLTESSDEFEDLSFDSDTDFWIRSATNTAQSPFLFFSDGSQPEPMPAPFQHAAYTVAALAVKCEHGAMPLSRLHLKSPPGGSSVFWLPFLGIKECFKYGNLPALLGEFFYKEAGLATTRARMLEDQKLSLFEPIYLHTISRVQTPTGEYFTRLFFVGHWKMGATIGCCQASRSIQWFPIEKLIGGGTGESEDNIKKTPKSKSKTKSSSVDVLGKLWGHEVAHYASYLKAQAGDNLGPLMQLTEQTKAEVYKYVAAPGGGGQSTSVTPGDTQTLFTDFLIKAGYGEMDVVKIYSDFVQHCYPSISMGLASFLAYAQKVKLSGALSESIDLKATFRAMNYKVKGYLGFNEFLIGLVALDPKSAQTLPRETFTFRYYDSDSDGQIDRDDLRRMADDISKLEPGGKARPAMPPAETNGGRLNLERYLALTSTSFKGVAQLVRATKSIIALLYESNQYELLLNRAQPRPFAPKLNATCPKCRSKDYTLATHSVRINLLGRIEDYKSVSVFTQEPTSTGNAAATSEPRLAESKYHKSIRRHSNEFIFKQTSTANQVLNLVRRLSGFNRLAVERQRELREQVVNGLTYSLIMSLCAEVTEVFGTELRVLKVQTPCYVLGDIHGNINDLLIYEEQLWQMAPAIMGPSALFLGDYVDRGEFSIEVVAYLFALKILAPNKFFMLRGNHEVRAIQRTFTFERECLEKYGAEKNGPNVFEAFNRVFDIMPFAAVIDESIFCAHGGIPFTHTKIEDLQRAPMAIAEPEAEAPAVWEILWSDPITNKEYDELTEFMKKKDETGYLSNVKRSTAFYFGEKATQAFLKKNNLSHVIRAHEVINEGYKFNHSGLVTTIFSSSHYCGGKNKAAAIMIEAFEAEGFIKIILLDTD